MAKPPAAVHFARQPFIARQATRNVLQMTWDVAALLWVDGDTDALVTEANNTKWAWQMWSQGEVTSWFPMHHFWVR